MRTDRIVTNNSFQPFLNWLWLLILAISVSLFSASGQAADDRQFIILVDTSGSMESSDSAKYSVQAAKIINDLLSIDDAVSLIRLTGGDSCGGYNSSIVAEGGAGGKARFDTLISSVAGGDNFSIPIETAAHLFREKKAARQLLLIITDVGGDTLLSACQRKTTLEKLKQQNVELTAININGGDVTNNNKLFSEAVKVRNSQELIKAIASVYQRFIGGKNPATGNVNQTITVNIDTYVKDAYLVVAADGQVGRIATQKNTLKAKTIDKDYKEGGETTGWDRRAREYKIVHLQRPQSGQWKFDVPDLTTNAGWMLIQDYSVGIRFISDPTVAEGTPATIQAKLYDEETGKDLPIEPGMDLELIDQTGKSVRFTNDGKTFTTTITPQKTGKLKYITRLQGRHVDKKSSVEFTVIKGSWVITPDVPNSVSVGQLVTLGMTITVKNGGKDLHKPKEVLVELSTGQTLKLKSVGNDRYEASWTPARTGKVSISFSTKGGNKSIAAKAEIQVLGNAKFGRPIPVDFGRVTSRSKVEKRLDFSNAQVFGVLPIRLELPYHKGNSRIELKLNGQWLPLDDIEEISLRQGRSNQWPVRLVVEHCPEGVAPGEPFVLRAWFKNASGDVVETQIPVRMSVVADAWIVCWWPYIVAGILLLLLLKIIHCILSPARFPSTFELLLSPESDLKEEGITHKVLNYKGTKSGFCRDARIYLHQDFRFSKSAKGAFLKFQARKDGVYIVVMGNGSLWGQRFGMDWEKVVFHEETPLRTGTSYRNEFETFFLKLRIFKRQYQVNYFS